MILHAAEQGSGPPVCLLHGLFGRAQNLASLARALASDYRVLSLDLRNHGASPHAATMTYDAMAQDVLETLASHAALPAALLGHSMGGKTAMRVALTASAQITRLIVADIAPVAYAHHNAGIAAHLLALALPPGLSRRDANAALAAAIPDPATRAFLLQNLTPGASPAWSIGLPEIAAAIPGIETWPPPPPQARYDGPTLFLAGTRSGYIQPAHQPRIRALFPHAIFQRIQDAGHWLHADQPAEMARHVHAFLANKAEAPAENPA